MEQQNADATALQAGHEGTRSNDWTQRQVSLDAVNIFRLDQKQG